MKNKTVKNGIAVLFALLLWQIVAMSVGSEMLLASPVQVVARLMTLVRERDFLTTAAYSFLRITAGFLAAFAVGIVLAIGAARLPVVETLLRPFLVTIKTVPVASFIILCLIWLSYSQLTVFISFLIVLPVIYSNVLQGIKSTPTELKEVAELYRVPWGRRLLYLYMPSICPYLLSACSISVGMAWKAGVAAEVIGVVDGSIGEKLYDAKIYFQNPDLLAWTVVLIVISVASEKLFLLLLKVLFGRLKKI